MNQLVIIMAKGTIRKYLEAIKCRVVRKTRRTQDASDDSWHVRVVEHSSQPRTKKSGCGLKRVPTPFPRAKTGGKPAAMSANEGRHETGHIKIVEPLPEKERKSSYGMRPSPFPVRDSYPGSKVAPTGVAAAGKRAERGALYTRLEKRSPAGKIQGTLVYLRAKVELVMAVGAGPTYRSPTPKDQGHISFLSLPQRPTGNRQSTGGLTRKPTPIPSRKADLLDDASATDKRRLAWHNRTVDTQAYALSDPDYEPGVPRHVGLVHPAVPVLAAGCSLWRVPTPMPGVGGI